MLPLKSSAADTSYQKLSFALFRWLEGVAKSDDKYTDVLLLENYYYFFHTFSACLPSLCAQRAAAARGEGQGQAYAAAPDGKYITWQCEYELKEVYRFWASAGAGAAADAARRDTARTRAGQEGAARPHERAHER